MLWFGDYKDRRTEYDRFAKCSAMRKSELSDLKIRRMRTAKVIDIPESHTSHRVQLEMELHYARC